MSVRVNAKLPDGSNEAFAWEMCGWLVGYGVPEDVASSIVSDCVWIGAEAIKP